MFSSTQLEEDDREQQILERLFQGQPVEKQPNDSPVFESSRGDGRSESDIGNVKVSDWVTAV